LLFPQYPEELEPQNSIGAYRKTRRHFGETGHLSGHIGNSHILTNKTELADGGFHRSPLKDRLSDLPVAFDKLLPSVADRAEDVGEAAIFSKMFRWISVNDRFDRCGVLSEKWRRLRLRPEQGRPSGDERY